MRTRVSRSLDQLREWAGVLALVLVLTGGVAYAADTIGSSDVIDNSLTSDDLKNNQAVRSADVRSEALTGADIKDQSGVDTCSRWHLPLRRAVRRKPRHHRTDLVSGRRSLQQLELRLPSTGEAMSLAKHYDVPTVGDFPEGQFFWTDEQTDSGSAGGAVVDEAGNLGNTPASNSGGPGRSA